MHFELLITIPPTGVSSSPLYWDMNSTDNCSTLSQIGEIQTSDNYSIVISIQFELFSVWEDSKTSITVCKFNFQQCQYGAHLQCTGHQHIRSRVWSSAIPQGFLVSVYYIWIAVCLRLARQNLVWHTAPARPCSALHHAWVFFKLGTLQIHDGTLQQLYANGNFQNRDWIPLGQLMHA
jgi:hypothetical protein